MPMTSDELLALLTSLGIAYRKHDHAAVMTVEESQRLRGDIAGVHTKNLFVKDRKGSFYLVVANESSAVRLKQLSRDIGAKGSLSFCSPEELRDRLGVAPGAVSPLALANDPEGSVTLVIERELLSVEILNCHPLDNQSTVSLSPNDLQLFLKSAAPSRQILAFVGRRAT
jgi:Ala-tRNA(Pro) deacylase